MFKLSELLRQTTKREMNYCIVGSIISQVIIIITVLFVYVFSYKTSIGVVNITGIADEFIKVQARSGVSPEELKKRVRVFGASLEKVLHDVGAKKHVILMPAEAVITGAEDYTQEVHASLSQAIQKVPQEPPSQSVQQTPLSQETKQPASQASYLEQQTLLQGINQTVLPVEINQTESPQEVPAV